MQKVESIRGKQKIIHNGNVYVKQKNLADVVISYEYEKRRGSGAGMSGCKAKIKVKDEVVIGTLHDTCARFTFKAVHSEQLDFIFSLLF